MPNLLISPSADPEKAVIGEKGLPGSTGPKYNEDANFLEEGEEQEQLDEDGEEKLEHSEEEAEEERLAKGEKEEEEEEITPEQEEKPNIPFDRPSIGEIKAKYPNLFKDFPQLRESYFREIEFTKLFPTAEDAREAFDDNEAFSTLSESVLSGDPAPLLESIEKTDKKALETFSLSFLPSLVKKDQNLYSQVVTPIFQNLVQAIYKDKDENIRNAALVLADWIFGSDGEAVAKGQKSVARSTVPTEDQKKIKEEKESRNATAFRESSGRVETKANAGLESLVLKSAAFDPNKVFSPALRKMGAQEVIKRLKSQLVQDQGHMTVMAARWKRARANGYTSDDESKIVSTFLARAKSLIPTIASKVSSEMLGTKKRAAEEKGERTRVFPKQDHSGSDTSANGTSQRNKKDYSKMTDLEILND